MPPRRIPRLFLPILLLVSGFCGISYEVLYAKLLGNLLGDQFTISATVLLTFLGGIGIGTLYAHRFVRWLWIIEAGIGLYAVAMVAAYDVIDRVLYSWVPALGTSVVSCALVSIALLAAPAFLVGCSVPLFAAYLSTLRSRHVFSMTYGIYNVGAALTALTMEFVLLRAVGLRSATLILAILNVIVAAGLLLLVRSAPLIPQPRSDRLRFSGRVLGALALASVGSAVFQLMMIRVAEFVIGPFNETFALVLAVVLLGLALGSVAAGRLGLTFSGALLLALVGIVTLLTLHSTVVSAYAEIRPEVASSYFLLVLLKLGLVLVLTGLPAIGFGATIPALLATHRDVARESGQLLFVSSMANVIGFTLMAFVLHRQLDYGPILLVVAALTTAGLVLHAGLRRSASWAAGILVLLAIGAHQQAWDESYLYFGHDNYLSPGKLADVKESRFFADKFKGYQDVFAITWKNGQPSFFINGYNSIPLTAVAEKAAGALSVTFSPRTDRALVLGVGSGATAATVGLMFEHTEAVEINSVILDNLFRMEQYNFNLEEMSGVEIVHDDGIHYIKTAPGKYSLIVNTVTTPIYFSSSKLYTRDFLEHVVAKLESDGIYTTWVDRDLGDRGVDIILESLDSVFETCWLAYLKSSYYLLICSNETIRPHQAGVVAGNHRLDRYLAENDELLSRLIPYSLLSTEALSLRTDDATPVNTLDFPVLEHELARLKRNKLDNFNGRLRQSIDLRDVKAAFDGIMRWDPGEFAVWGDMRVRPSASLAGILDEVVREQFGDVTRDYERAALSIAEEVGTSTAYHRYGYRLYQREAYAGSSAAFSKVVELDPANSRAHYYLGRSSERLGDLDRARDHLREALRLDPEDDSARQHLERLAVALPSRTEGPDG